jgi:hypothetical protein
MFHKAAIVLAITMVIGSLSAARAEDPEENVVEHLRAGFAFSRAELRHHGVPFAEPQRSTFAN